MDQIKKKQKAIFSMKEIAKNIRELNKQVKS